MYIVIIFPFRVFEILQNIASGKEELDMERMKSQIHRAILEEMNAVSFWSLTFENARLKLSSHLRNITQRTYIAQVGTNLIRTNLKWN